MGSVFSKGGSKEKKREADKPDTVYLYQFSRWVHGPCQSMPCLRVESFLRLYKIPHVIIPSMKSGPYGRWPWARYNGQVLTDSQLIIDHVMSARGLTEPLTEEQKGIALAIERMLDFHVYPFVIRWSWVDNMEVIRRFSSLKLPGPQFCTTLLQNFVRRGLIKYLNTGGWGEYSNEEYRKQWVADIKAIEQILGSKPFLFGEQPTRIDASVFAYLQASTSMPDEFTYEGIRELMKPGTPLRAYVDRISDRLYPDMDAIKGRAGSIEREVYPPALTM